MGSRIHNQENRKYAEAEQNYRTYKNRGSIGDRSTKLIDLIGLERITWRHFQFEGTFYVTEDGETYDDKYVKTHNPPKTGVNFYEVSNWTYNEKKEIYEPIIRRIVIIKIKEIQLSLDL